MTSEESPSLERVYYECWLYGHGVYMEFAQYCFWRRVVEYQNPQWLASAPAYYVKGGSPDSSRTVLD